MLVTVAAVLDFSQDAAVRAFRARAADLESVLLLVSQFAWLRGRARPALRRLARRAPRRGGGGVRCARSRGGCWRAWTRAALRFERGLRALVAEGWPGAVAAARGGLRPRRRVQLKALGSSVDVACFNVAYLLSQPFGFLASALSMAAPAAARRPRASGSAGRSSVRPAESPSPVDARRAQVPARSRCRPRPDWSRRFAGAAAVPPRRRPRGAVAAQAARAAGRVFNPQRATCSRPSLPAAALSRWKRWLSAGPRRAFEPWARLGRGWISSRTTRGFPRAACDGRGSVAAARGGIAHGARRGAGAPGGADRGIWPGR